MNDLILIGSGIPDAGARRLQQRKPTDRYRT
jgi:hypothetical protein